MSPPVLRLYYITILIIVKKKDIDPLNQCPFIS